MTVQNSTELRLLKSLTLPSTGPGPLHTIVSDADENLYYSDELNHTVVSLDRDGRSRWRRTTHGNDSGEFSYPRGLSLGWIQIEGKCRQCLGIADAWNQRVQFLDFSGNYLDSWNQAGSDFLSEPSDIRFIPQAGPHGSAFPGYWLVLEKGNHRLSGLSPSGKLLFQIGRCFAPFLLKNWISPNIVFKIDPFPPGALESFPPVDFLYYPDRILGTSENALYVWEPSHRILKRILYGNFLPLSLPDSGGMEWVSASASGFLAYDREAGAVRLYDKSGEPLQESKTGGRPVPSDLPADEVWLQFEDQIQRCTWENTNSGEAVPPHSELSALRRSAEAAILRLDMNEAKGHISDLVRNMESCMKWAAELSSKARITSPEEKAWETSLSTVQQLVLDRVSILENFRRTFHSWRFGVLELRLLALEKMETELEEHIGHARDTWNLLVNPVMQQFGEIQKSIDRLFMFRQNMPEQPDVESLSRRTHQIEYHLVQLRNWLLDWCGALEGKTEICESPQAGSAVCMPAVRPYRQIVSCFREIERISLAPYCSGVQAKPTCMTLSPDGGLFVGLFGDNCVLHLDSRGRLLERIGCEGNKIGEIRGPGGLALDNDNALWVVDYFNHRIQIFDTGRRTARAIGGFGRKKGEFRNPEGMCRHLDSALVCDSANQRIVRVTSGGICDVFCPEADVENPLLHPATLSRDPGGHLWCSDPLAHSIFKLDSAGRVIKQIGGLGFGKENMLRPISVTFFDSGNLVFAQNEWTNCLRLFNPEGEELGRFYPEYQPAHVLARGDQLLVTSWEADCIYVYERK